MVSATSHHLMSLANIKEQLARRLITSLAILCIIALPLSLYRWVDIGFQFVYVHHIGVSLFVFTLFFLRYYLSAKSLISCVVLILTSMTISGAVSFGLQSGTVTFGIFSTFIIAFIWGFKASIAYIVAWSLFSAVLGILFTQGYLHYSVAPDVYAVLPSAWAIVIIGTLISAVFILITGVTFYQSFQNLLQIIEQQKCELQEQATTDALTGLYNTRGCEHEFNQLKAISLRNQQQLALAFLDLDKFKQINDHHGHHIGDKVLIHVAEKIKTTIRASDIACRAGGDEFIVILSNITSHQEIREAIKRLETAIETQLNEEELVPELSFGVAVFPKHGKSLEALKKHADQRMYEAKKHSTDTILELDFPLNKVGQS